MSARWLDHFGLDDAPFSKEIEAAELWVPSSRQAVVDDLVDGCEERGHVLLTGEPGVGKTCILRALQSRLPDAGFRLTYCHNATLGRRDFYRQLCLALGLSPKATAAGVFFEVSSHVQQLGHERIHPVFLLDEAHLLHQDVLDHLHILANYEWDSRALLSLLLVGLPEMHDRMHLRRNRSLWSRIHTRLHLGEATPEDTAEYVGYRLERVSGKQDTFSSDALALLHEASGGRLRDIDRIATGALKRAARRKLKKVDRQLVQDVVGAD
ncbi:MAG: AAA family ATPase [Rhodanobacter sp.]|jgi:type II secretory pathway predicted ATPase ExeA|nr:AAA family ATPase [Rhodanobacter sp.]